MSKKESFVKRLLDKLLALQEELRTHSDVRSRLIEGEGKAGLLEVYGPDGGVYGFKVERGRIRPYEGGNYDTIISLSEDTFLDLLSGDLDLDDAWARGLVEFYGKNWMVDAQKFKEGFRQLRHLIAEIWRRPKPLP